MKTKTGKKKPEQPESTEYPATGYFQMHFDQLYRQIGELQAQVQQTLQLIAEIQVRLPPKAMEDKPKRGDEPS